MRGESLFISNDTRVKDTLNRVGVEGVEYRNGIPDFSIFAMDEVKIEGMTNDRIRNNYVKADKELARIWTVKLKDGKEWTIDDVKDWRVSNGYTWHELNDMKTMQLIPSCINHPIFKHLGGCGEYELSIGC